MVITRITKENELKFNYLFPREAWAHDSDLIRLGAIDDEGKGVAALSARVEGRNIRIISLFVLEGHRRRGIGRMMVKWFETFLLDQEIDVLDTEYFETDASNAFALAMGFDLFDTKPVYSFTIGDVLRSPLYKRHIEGRSVHKVRTISSLSFSEKKILKRAIGGSDGDPDWSTVVIEKGRYSSSLLVTHGKSDVSLILIHSESEDKREVLYHIRAVVFKTLKEFPDRRDIEFRLTFLDRRRVDNLAGLLGGRGHLREAGCYRHAVKLL